MQTARNRITLLIPSLAMGGAESVCVNLANNFSAQDWQVDLIILNLNHAVYLDRLDTKVNLINLNVSQARHAIPALARQLNTPQTLLVFSYELTLLLILIKHGLRKPISIIAYNPSTISNNSKNIRGRWKRWLLSRAITLFYDKADFIICQSQGIWEDFVQLFPQATTRTCIIYNPVSSAIEKQAHRIDWQNVQKQDYLLCVGRLEIEKGYDDAIRAFAHIQAQFPQLRLKFVGAGRLEAELKALVATLRIEDKVDFEGFQPDVIPYYQGAKATLLTSHYEGLPNVLIESITLGTPIIAFDCPSGPREIVMEGKNGYLIPNRVTNRLEAGIIDCLEKSWDYRQVHQTADKFSSQQIISAYSDIIKAHYVA
jgi:glycosyltransferase involved in cell wall biosynthesis